MSLYLIMAAVGCCVFHKMFSAKELTGQDMIVYLIGGLVLLPIMVLARINYLLADKSKKS